MALVYFNTRENFIEVATPSNDGFVIGYDLDGCLKQKNSYGTISNIFCIDGSGSNFNHFTQSITIEPEFSGPTVSFNVREDSLTPDLLAVINGPETGKVLSYDGGSFSWITVTSSVGGGSYSLKVSEYEGGSFSDINHIEFRGGTVKTEFADDSDAVWVEGYNANPKVVVWIPAPSYAELFNPSLFIGTDRHVTTPDQNIYTMSNSLGDFEIGDWSGGDVKKTTNSSVITAFTDNEFACLDENTTIDFILYGGDNVTVLDNIHLDINNVNVGSTSSTLGGLTININSFEPDSDRFKTNINGTINLSTILPNGGRFGFLVRHTNSTEGVHESSRLDQFYDYDNNGDNSTADITGDVTLEENQPINNFVSGVAFYKMGSSFTASVIEMDLLDEISYPTDTQLFLDFTNMNMNDVSLTAGANGYIGWDETWDISNVNFIKSYNTTSNSNLPGLTSDNELNLSNLSKLRAYIYDWGGADDEISPSYKFMFFNPSSISDRNTEDFVNENRRLIVKDALISGNETSYNSNNKLDDSASGYNYELQQLFGRLVYPKIDFNPWFPKYNDINNVDYSTLSSVNVNLNVITDVGTLTSSTVTHNGYKWYLRRFDTVNGAASNVGNGIFEFNTDFMESDLLTGSGNLLLYMGLTNDSVPDKWYDLSKQQTDTPIAGPRVNAIGNGSDNLDDNGNISWNTGTIQGWSCYLLVGVKSTATTKEITEINITGVDSPNSWD